MPAYDYTTVADIYDDFCVFEDDLVFFREIAASTNGPVLELMAGTGRVSLAMLETGAELTCVDRYAAMLATLARKLRGRQRAAALICADVCNVPLSSSFETVVLPFQGFTELVSEAEQHYAFSEASRLLTPEGRFVCTSHNPAVRRATIDGAWHELGRFHNRDEDTLVLQLRTDFSDRPGVVEGRQRIDIFDPGGTWVERREFDMSFSLVPPDEILAMAASVGMRPLSLLGDYRGSAFDEESSPCFVAVFGKNA